LQPNVTDRIVLCLGTAAVMVCGDVRDWVVSARSAWTAHLISLLVMFAVLLQCGSHQWFFTDEWEYITATSPAWAGWVRATQRALVESTGQQLTMLPRFVWHGLSATADGALGLPVVGTVMLVALTAWLVVRRRQVSSTAIGGAAGALSWREPRAARVEAGRASPMMRLPSRRPSSRSWSVLCR
jgi:hypothetical protein